MSSVRVNGGSPRSSRAGQQLVHRGEAIRIEAQRFGYFPQAFVWRRRRYHIQAVERYWVVPHPWAFDTDRHYFRVRCAEGTFDLYREARRNTWHMDHFEPAPNSAGTNQ